ncbi:MAG: hypothetical protein NT007_11885 [Candidatus Kapabacteria bacterium]|nr:hypothetical protein [Candidatus Kapabacteria bacterium]
MGIPASAGMTGLFILGIPAFAEMTGSFILGIPASAGMTGFIEVLIGFLIIYFMLLGIVK